jgi:hypothetical protein
MRLSAWVLVGPRSWLVASRRSFHRLVRAVLEPFYEPQLSWRERSWRMRVWGSCRGSRLWRAELPRPAIRVRWQRDPEDHHRIRPRPSLAAVPSRGESLPEEPSRQQAGRAAVGCGRLEGSKRRVVASSSPHWRWWCRLQHSAVALGRVGGRCSSERQGDSCASRRFVLDGDGGTLVFE